MPLRLEMGRGLLRDEGTALEVRDDWMMAVMRGSREGREAVTREGGRWMALNSGRVLNFSLVLPLSLETFVSLRFS